MFEITFFSLTIRLGRRELKMKASATITIKIGPAPLTIEDQTLNGNVSVPFTGSIVAKGGKAPLSFVLAPGASLPDGLTAMDDGSITGTPTTEGTTTFGVSVQDADEPPPTA